MANPDHVHVDLHGESMNPVVNFFPLEQREPDEATEDVPSTSGGVVGTKDSRRMRSATSIRKATGVLLQTCFNSAPFPDCLQGLVPLLYKDNQRVAQEQAARALAELSNVESRQFQIARLPNAITGLVRLLSRRYGTRVRQYAAVALGNIGAALDIQTFMQRMAQRPDALYHFVRALVPLLFRDESPSLQDQACRALTDVSSVRTCLEEIGAAPGAIAGFVRLLSKTENSYGQECAALSLSNLAISTDNTSRIVHCPGALRILVGLLLADECPSLQENATMTLRHLAYARENAIAIKESAAFPVLLNGLAEIIFRPVDHPSGVLVQELATKTLLNLSVTQEIIEKMENFPNALLEGLVYSLFKEQSHSAEYAAMALGNLALCKENIRRISDTPNSFVGLVKLLLRFENPVGQKEALFTVFNLSYGDDDIKMKIAELPDALKSLVTLLFKTGKESAEAEVQVPITTQDSSLQECAVNVLCNLTCVEQNSTRIAEFPRAIEGLVALFLDKSNPLLQERVAVVLSNLAIEARNKVIIGEFPNVLAGLVRSLFAEESPGLQEYAAQALSRLTDVEATQVKIFSEFPDVLKGLVLMLEKRENPAVQESAAWALTNLAGSRPNRVKMTEFPGALACLKKAISEENSTVVQENAIICLSRLAIEDKAKTLILEFPNMLADCVHLICECETPRIQGLSALFLARLAETWRIQLKVCRFPGADVTALLTQLLNTKDKSACSRVQEFASWAIGNLAAAPENQSRIASCPGTTQSLVRLLCESSSTHSLKHLVARALANLAEEEQNRAAMRGALDGLASLLDSADHVDQQGRWLSKWSAAKALTLIDFSRGKELVLQSAKAYAGRGEALLIDGMYEEALADMNEANRLDPDCATTCSFRSFVKTMLNDCEGALPDADRAVELEPEYLGRWAERGTLRRIMGNLKGALSDLDKAIEMDFDEEGDYELLKHRGYTKFLLGDYAGARADAERAIGILPECISFGRLPVGLCCLPVNFLSYDLQ